MHPLDALKIDFEMTLLLQSRWWFRRPSVNLAEMHTVALPAFAERVRLTEQALRYVTPFEIEFSFFFDALKNRTGPAESCAGSHLILI
ncbi:hypothetical protein EVAR_45745_1 [Eumeta japonica]|uniref:Uncharacterized protein n=1 Tax=Eumeta variegata TaxID=151549 RepID=A0A4C1YR36_EUMVA|nr:hypothetical protein EVAR_45745_1 [Eumeta japonica]